MAIQGATLSVYYPRISPLIHLPRYGNAINVKRTVHGENVHRTWLCVVTLSITLGYANRGAACVMIEDQASLSHFSISCLKLWQRKVIWDNTIFLLSGVTQKMRLHWWQGSWYWYCKTALASNQFGFTVFIGCGLSHRSNRACPSCGMSP